MDFDLEDHQRGIKRITIDLPLDIWTLAKSNIMEFKETLIFGIKFKMSEKDSLSYPYPNNNLSNKILKLQKIIEQMGETVSNLEEKEENGKA